MSSSQSPYSISSPEERLEFFREKLRDAEGIRVRTGAFGSEITLRESKIIESYQGFFNLEKTGELNDEIWEKLSIYHAELTEYKNSEETEFFDSFLQSWPQSERFKLFSQRRFGRANQCGGGNQECRWNNRHLNWNIADYGDQVDNNKIFKCVKKAFDIWGNVGVISFVNSNQNPHIKIFFVKKNDKRLTSINTIYGRASYPNTQYCNTQTWVAEPGIILIRGGDQWGEKNSHLLRLMLHEIGHVLGHQGHCNTGDSVMKTQDFRDLPKSLSEYDKAWLRGRYR